MPNTDTRPRFAASELSAFTTRAFEHFGLPPDDAAVAAEVLVDADLAGIESHGIAHLAAHRGYAPGLRSGIVNPKPAVKVVRDSPVAATWDADGGLGVLTSRRAMEVCLEKARATGIGMVAVRNGRHFGAAGYYAHMAAKEEMIGMAMCNVPPIAVAAGGLDRVYGTNPIAFGAPIEGDHAFLLDIATTAVAGGKLEIAMRQGKRVPHGWVMNAEGADSDDPAALRNGGALLPLGSRLETSSHKGYGLGLMVDILSGLLPGGASGLWSDVRQLEQGHWFAAWRIDAFRDLGEFKADMKRLVDSIRATRPEPGRESVLVPGDPEHRARADRSVNGVPLDAETVEGLQKLAEEIGSPFPAARS